MYEDTPHFCFQAVAEPHPENTVTHFLFIGEDDTCLFST